MPVSDYEYQPLATDDEEKPQPRSQRQEPTSDVRELHRRLEEDPRFNPPTPAAWKRVLLIIAMLILLWIGIRLRVNAIPQEPQVVHANRYVSLFGSLGGWEGDMMLTT